jgi:hypothetical protein
MLVTEQASGPISQIDTGVGTRVIHSSSITGLNWNSNYEYRVQQPQTKSFQQGVSGYTDTVDTTLREATPATNNALTASLAVDDDEQTLLRFDGIFGSGPGQVPAGSTIYSATLQLQVSNSGSAVRLHSMLQLRPDTDTWDSLGAGVQTDGVEAASSADVTTGQVTIGSMSIDVTSRLQAWSSNPLSNLGWVILSTGVNGVDFDSAEGVTPPRLEIQSSGGPSLPLVTIAATDSKLKLARATVSSRSLGLAIRPPI